VVVAKIKQKALHFHSFVGTSKFSIAMSYILQISIRWCHMLQISIAMPHILHQFGQDHFGSFFVDPLSAIWSTEKHSVAMLHPATVMTQVFLPIALCVRDLNRSSSLHQQEHSSDFQLRF
jgi:hypothetical protein